MKIEDLELIFGNLLKALALEDRMQIIKNGQRFDLGLLAMENLIAERRNVPQSLNPCFMQGNWIEEDVVCPYKYEQSRWPCEGFNLRLIKVFSGDVAFLCLNGSHSSQSPTHLVFNDERLTNYDVVCGCCCDRFLPPNFDSLLNEAAARFGVKRVVVHGKDFDRFDQARFNVSFIANLPTGEWEKPENAELLEEMRKINRKVKKVFTSYGFGERLK